MVSSPFFLITILFAYNSYLLFFFLMGFFLHSFKVYSSMTFVFTEMYRHCYYLLAERFHHPVSLSSFVFFKKLAVILFVWYLF